MERAQSIALRDGLERKLQWTRPASRVCSLVPSQTELLEYLGADVVGITRYCTRPKGLSKTARIIGGTKNPDIEQILALKPDLVVANQEENRREDIAQLQDQIPVYVSRVQTIEDNYRLIGHLSLLINASDRAMDLQSSIARSLAEFRAPTVRRALYLIWRKPWMSVGGDTFISSMMQIAGFQNCCAEQQRYPSLSAEEMQSLNPDVILLSSEPFPFKEKHMLELGDIFPNRPVLLCDGQAFSWYGLRPLYAREEFERLNSQLNKVV